VVTRPPKQAGNRGSRGVATGGSLSKSKSAISRGGLLRGNRGGDSRANDCISDIYTGKWEIEGGLASFEGRHKGSKSKIHRDQVI